MVSKKKSLPKNEKHTFELPATELLVGQFIKANDGEFRKIIQIDPVMNIPRIGNISESEQVVLRLDKITHSELELRTGTIIVLAA
jgi:hypothetical protein